jgi:hypothetical protein
VLSSAECPALGKGALCREPDFTECGSRQSLLCRVPDKRHSANNPTLGKDSDSGSEGYDWFDFWLIFCALKAKKSNQTVEFFFF